MWKDAQIQKLKNGTLIQFLDMALGYHNPPIKICNFVCNRSKLNQFIVSHFNSAFQDLILCEKSEYVIIFQPMKGADISIFYKITKSEKFKISTFFRFYFYFSHFYHQNTLCDQSFPRSMQTWVFYSYLQLFFNFSLLI